MRELVDQNARDRIKRDLVTTLVVEAAAGTGKTTALVSRILSLVMSGTSSLAQLVAVTFTEKSAGEMKLRLRSEIEKARALVDLAPAEKERLDAALAELEAAHIGTIHGFCADLLREWPIEAAVDPLFEMCADDARDRLFDEAFDAWFQDELAEPSEGVRRVLRRRSRERDASGPRHALRRAGLDMVEQRDFDAPWRRAPFDRTRAIDMLLGQLRELGGLAARAQWPDDWLGKNLAEVARFIDELDRRELIRPRDHDGLESELKNLAHKKKGWTWKGGGKNYGKGLLRADVMAQRDAAKAELDRVLGLCDADLAACLHEELSTLVKGYEALKARAGRLDFLDLLVKTRDLLRDQAGVRKALQERFTHLLVDEFQDTDPLQAEIVLLLSADDPAEDSWLKVRVTPGKLFVVGDPKQSIYRFRRADVALYEDIKRRLERGGASVLHLSTSFRSAPAIQRLVNEAFAATMKGGDDGSQASYVALEPFRDDPVGRPAVVALPVPRPYSDWGKVVGFRIDESLPDAVGAFVDFLITKSGWTITERERPELQVPIEARHICLLFKRFQNFGEDKTRGYVRALEARSIPHVLMGGRSYHAREEVLGVRNALAAIEWPDDEMSVFATLRGPFFALGDDPLLAYKSAVGSWNTLKPTDGITLDAPSAEVAEAIAILRKLHLGRNRRPIADTLAQLFEATRAHAGVGFWPSGEQALANLLRVTDLARRFEAQGATSFRAFVMRMAEEAERGGAAEAPVVEEGTDGVRIMTVHRAKGLEFPVVILVDPTAPKAMREPSRYSDPETRLFAMPLAGCVPVELMEKRDDVLRRDEDEAIRLLYVAATRARELLVVPVVGDEELAGWLDTLNPVIQPRGAERRRALVAPGCPPFGGDSVLARTPKVDRTSEDSIAPGLHHGRAGGHPVVWWDPASLELDKQHDAGLRQQKLLEADKSGATIDDGTREHDAWSARRADLLARGAVPSVILKTVTERARGREGAPSEIIVTEEEVTGRRSERPQGKRFGTLVHAVLAEIEPGADDATLLQVAAKQGRLVGAPDDEVGAAAEAVRGALGHPLLLRAAASARSGGLRREVPIMMTDGEGALIEGVVDLAFREGEGDAAEWIVVDYKTDAEIAASGRSRYEAQVALYAEAVARATGQRARGVLLRV